VTDNGKVLLFGGADANGKATNQVVSVDPAGGSASSAGSLAKPVRGAAAAVVDGTPTVFGGSDGSVMDSVQTFSNGTSTEIGTLPAPREHLTAATANGKTYLFGGDDGNSTQADILSTSDGKTFATVGKLATPVRSPAVTTVGDADHQTVMIFGGQGDNGASDAIQQFDPATGTTTKVGTLPSGLQGATAFEFDGATWLAGGATGGQASTKIWKFNPSDNSVTEAGNLPDAVTDAAAAVTSDKAYLLGGTVNDKATDAVTELTPQ
jgi:N-acetylneuraminic acid mutarotase